MLRQFLDLPRAVHVLCLGTFINRAGAFVVLFLTFYLQEELQLGGIFATQAIGFFGLGTFLAALIGGQLADTIGRKTVMLISLLGGASILLAFGHIRYPPLILAATALFAFLMDMYRPAVSAMISDIVSVEQRPHAFGLMYIAINLGAAVAPLVGGLLATRAFAWLFWGDAATSAAYAGIIALCVRETLVREPRGGIDSANSAKGPFHSAVHAYGRMLHDGPYVRFCLGTLFLSFVYMQSISTFPLYLKSLSLGPEVYGRAISLNGLLVVLLQVPMTHLVTKFNRVRMIVFAALTTGLGFGLNGLAATPLAFSLTVVVWTIGELMQSPLVPSIVSDLAPADLRARYFGLLTMCYSGGNLIAGPLGGWVLVRFGGGWLWGGCVGIGLLSAALYASVRVRAPTPATH
ncbi:MAG: MFS transporter [Planctomycetota bacterium]